MTAQRTVCLVGLYFIALRGRRLRCFRVGALRREVVFVDFFLVTFYGCSNYFLSNDSWSYTTENRTRYILATSYAINIVHRWTQMFRSIKWEFRLNLTFVVDFRISGKPAFVEGLTYCFLAEAQRTQRWHVFFGKNSIALLVFLCVLCASARKQYVKPST